MSEKKTTLPEAAAADGKETIEDATRTFFHGQKVGTPDIRVSHVIKGRIPEAVVLP